MNLLSIDVDDYRTVQLESHGIPLPVGYEPTVQSFLTLCLAALQQRGITATFFVQGWIARRWPALIRSIAAAGHEIASHGMTHHLVDRMARAAFAASASDSRRLLEDITGIAVLGYRSPCFSAIRIFDDAQSILLDAGYAYDSSAHFRRWSSIDRHAKAAPLRVMLPGGLVEFPLSTIFAGRRGISIGSSFYTRRLPIAIHRRLLEKAAAAAGGIHVYFHPYELAAEGAPLFFRLRHPRSLAYVGNAKRGALRLQRLLDSRLFAPIASMLETEKKSPRTMSAGQSKSR